MLYFWAVSGPHLPLHRSRYRRSSLCCSRACIATTWFCLYHRMNSMNRGARSAQIPPQVNLLTCTQEPRQHGNLGLHVRHGGDPNSIDTGHARRDAGTFHKGGIHRESTHGSGTECVIVPRCLGKSSSATRACPSRSSERPVISAYLFFCRPSAIASMASIPSASGQNLQTLGFIGHQEQE